MKPIHMAGKINQNGGVSAICFSTPRAISLRVASWTLVTKQVTCTRCLLVLKGAAR